ncbi:phosphoadenosine phosphosulfate reductase family protein [uncultured Desulfobulbus sp.]|uniref:phosphoadenosine phosphosulfate reductase family protein n=1 Tax=uncultured Desulfobulbus sp. TaxID=239745 RepID=UPI0029C6BC00|nr:phosphoadenosine phosphosulfate reductase family protein [uncultured Desulfobulbus sp.]
MKKSDERRHVLSLSGGKDSAALAVYLHDKIPNLEYVFMDTGYELPETYDFLQRMRAMLGIEIKVLKPKRDFETWLELKGGYLPSPFKRWCTDVLKISPYELYIGNDKIFSYIGIRADEDREGYLSSKDNIIPRYPFIEDGLVYADIENLLESSGLGFPEYYKWRSRSGCFFCFFQQKIEWVNLHNEHPDLFKKAMEYEKVGKDQKRFTWSQEESLSELIERKEQIIESFKDKVPVKLNGPNGRKLVDILGGCTQRACIVCDL